jgi:hypothetical protein
VNAVGYMDGCRCPCPGWFGEYKKVAQEPGNGELMVVLGSPDAGVSEFYAEILVREDPGEVEPPAPVVMGIALGGEKISLALAGLGNVNN